MTTPPVGIHSLAAVDLLDDLNAPQRQAVGHAGGPLLVVAGAGSGKTRVLTRRIAYLVAERGVHPGAILAITFTNKAAAEMRGRVEELVGRRARLMWVSTFHSACVRLLRADIDQLGWAKSFVIYDETDSRRLMAQVLHDLNLDPKRFAPRAVRHWVSHHKNQLVDVDEARAEAGDHPLHAHYADAYADYQQRLRRANALDFDDLLMTTVRLLRACPTVRERYRRRFRHVLVDEYQDTNHAQYALIHELCSPQVPWPPGDAQQHIDPLELMVVGDSDQSIYGFRGANIRNILDFERDFPGAVTITLEQNYRSTQNVLAAANAVIAHNRGRPPKNLWSAAGPGEPLRGHLADSEHDEAKFIADEVARLVADHGVHHRDVAVFYRTNAQSRALEEVFVRAGLPYKIVGGVRFYERREIRDVLAYLRTLANPADDVSLRRIINVPKRGIGDTSVAALEQFAAHQGIPLADVLDRLDEVPGLTGRALKPLTAFAQVLADHRALVADGLPADQLLASILDATGYVRELEASQDTQDHSRLENVAELVAVASEFVLAAGAERDDDADEPVPEAGPSAGSALDAPRLAAGDPGLGAASPTAENPLLGAPEPDDSLAAFLERVALVADSDQLPDPDNPADHVTLMTLHTAKGLEFDTVFLTGFEDGVFPHQRALEDPDGLEEERRLAYVGITRARSRLYLTQASTRTLWGSPTYNPPSRFLDEIPDQLIEWDDEESTGRPGRPAGRPPAANGSWRPGLVDRDAPRPRDREWDDRRATGRGQRERGGGPGPGDRAERRPDGRSGAPLGMGTTSRLIERTKQRSGSRVADLAVGERVLHTKFGLGKVVEVTGEKDKTARIDFGSHGVKLLSLAHAPLERLDD